MQQLTSKAKAAQSHKPGLDPSDPFVKNLLDACLAYTGYHYSITNNVKHSMTVKRPDGSDAYLHYLLIPPSETVEVLSSLGQLKMFHKLNAHLTLISTQKRNIFEWVAYQKDANTIAFRWQCVDPSVLVPAEELALLPQEGCAVGTLVVARTPASRIAHIVLNAGGAVPAYRAAYEANKTKSTGLSSATGGRPKTETKKRKKDFPNLDQDEMRFEREGNDVGNVASTAAANAAAITPTTAISATTPSARGSFGTVLQQLTPIVAPSNLLEQLSSFTEEELPEGTWQLMLEARAQEAQLQQEKQAIALAANTALQAYIAQQQKTLADVNRRRTQLTGTLVLPVKEAHSTLSTKRK